MKQEDVIEILGRFVIGAKPCSQREIVDACASAYRMLKEHPSLPSNLDEAAEKASENRAKSILNYSEFAYQEHLRGFKAGAKWMAEQGYTTTGRIIDEMAYYDIQFDELLPNNICDPKDKVIVQIRKKQ